MIFASPRRSLGSPRRRTLTFFPASCNLRPATKPSPPLFPLPQMIVMRSAFEYCAVQKSATAIPAFSMRVVDGTPNFSEVARSISRISAAVTIFMYAPSQPPGDLSYFADHPLRSDNRRQRSDPALGD